MKLTQLKWQDYKDIGSSMKEGFKERFNGTREAMDLDGTWYKTPGCLAEIGTMAGFFGGIALGANVATAGGPVAQIPSALVGSMVGAVAGHYVGKTIVSCASAINEGYQTTRYKLSKACLPNQKQVELAK